MNWIQRPLEDDTAVTTLLREGHQLPPALARVLAVRGIDSVRKARRFFREGLANLPDPRTMAGMEAASERLAYAIRRKERIMVYGDLDADGVSSVALLKSFLDRHNATSSWFVISRTLDRRGLVRRGVNEAKRQDAKVLVVADCGIHDTHTVAYAQSLGIDVIICDHHEPEEELPQALAIINPAQPECAYPFKHHSACGLAFRLAQATAMALGQNPDTTYSLLDLVALATVADVVALQGENRILVREGLRVLRRGKRPGLRALATELKLAPKHIGASSIGWKLGPCLNAAGRLDDASLAVRLLLAKTDQSARTLAQRLRKLNERRREESHALEQVAYKQAEVQVQGEHDGVLVLAGAAWYPGILGLVAGRIAEKFSRPAIVLSLANGRAKGSARSFGSIHLYDALTTCNDLLNNFGGHAGAAGLELRKENILPLRQRLSAFVKERLTAEDLARKVHYDAVLALSDLDTHFLKLLNYMEPCGEGNEAPVFLSHNLEASNANVVGSNALKFCARQAHATGRRNPFEVIAFGQGNHYAALKDGTPFDMVYTVEYNHFRGKTTLQLNSKGIRAASRAVA